MRCHANAPVQSWTWFLISSKDEGFFFEILPQKANYRTPGEKNTMGDGEVEMEIAQLTSIVKDMNTDAEEGFMTRAPDKGFF